MPRNGQRKPNRLAAVPDFDLLIAAANACPHGLAIERKGVVAFANPAYASLLGFRSAGRVIGKSGASLRRALRSSTAPNGNGNRPELDSMQMEFAHGAEKLRLEILRDISERRRLEQQLRVSQKMEALGRAVGGVAHDFNNLLTAVMLYCDLLSHQIPPDSTARRHADEINMAAQRGASMVRQMLAFARQQVLQPRRVSLNVIIVGMKNMLQRLIGEDIELVTRCADALGEVKVDPAQMQQVILNLAVNARDAMPGGGTLTVETANVRLSAAASRHYPGLRAGRCVRLTVADTGCGMSRETLAHIFEPFFTTKEKGKGTGLGLPMVYGIVTQSGGAISVDSQEGKGTRVSILLPCAKAGARNDTPAFAADNAQPAHGSGTVLLVEDDASVREPAAEVLRQAGYSVLQAREGREALRVLAQHRGPIHLLITDVIMPCVRGGEIARAIRAQRPGTRVLYMSGYTDELRKLAAAEPGCAVLQKPFTQTALTRKVRQVLDESPALAAAAGRQHT